MAASKMLTTAPRRSARTAAKAMTSPDTNIKPVNKIYKQTKSTVKRTVKAKVVVPNKVPEAAEKVKEEPMPVIKAVETIEMTEETTKKLASRFEYDYDKAVAHLCKIDPDLAELIKRKSCDHYRKRSECLDPNPFKSLARAIIYQQLAGAACAAILKRFLRLFKPEEDIDISYYEQELWFPTPEMVLAKSIEELKSAGLSGRKAEYLQDLARHFVDKRIDVNKFPEMTDAEISEALCAVKGIGQWTVDMYLMFHMRHPDILPVTDLGVRKGMAVHFNLPDPKTKALYAGKKVGKTSSTGYLPGPEEMQDLAEKWRPYRSIGCWYMWLMTDTKLMDSE